MKHIWIVIRLLAGIALNMLAVYTLMQVDERLLFVVLFFVLAYIVSPNQKAGE